MKKLVTIFTIIAVALTCTSFIFDFTRANATNSSFRAWGLKRAPEGQIPEVPKNIQDELAQNNAIWIGDVNEKKMYLTFDCGYELGYTPKILDALKTTNTKSIFFVTGHFVDKNPELIKRMNDDGHIIGNHSDKHLVMPKTSEEVMTADLKALESKVKSVLGDDYVMSYLRPPKGEYSVASLKLSQNLGYKTLFWSSAYVDWEDDKKGDLDYSFNSIAKQFHNGSIILLHNTSSNNADVLERAINDALEKGYTFGNCSE
ncbi:MAG: polysaccharide deacetylase family protein, partial [Oscillospiraceae bacterium]|nr:polysaccharide deacetylase family protein [Oscillospiraceae bacterium]